MRQRRERIEGTDRGITRQNQTDRARWGGELVESEQTAPELTRSRQMWSAVDVADSNVFVSLLLNCRWKSQLRIASEQRPGKKVTLGKPQSSWAWQLARLKPFFPSITTLHHPHTNHMAKTFTGCFHCNGLPM